MKIPTLLFLFTVILIACSPSTNEQQTPVESPKPPNIVIVFTDDQGYQDLGCFGSPKIKTPHIDKMAQEGIKLTNFYVSQPVCSASRASLLTGCYPNRLGIHGAYMPDLKGGLNHEETTIAEMLKPLGYSTAIYGKWHLGDHPDYLPTKHGFDEYFGIPYSNDMWPHHPWQGSIFNFPELPLFENETIIDTLDDQSLLTTQITERAVDFINRNKENPFFLYVPHPQPHVPLFVSDKFKGKSERGLYGDVIMEIDWSVGEILKALKENGIEENTLVIFTSDNGPWLSYGPDSGSALPLREGKGTAWEGGVRVPFIMQWKGQVPSGKTISTNAMTIDLLPSIAAITGAQLPNNKIDGKDITPILKGNEEAKNPHDAYYLYYKRNELHAVLMDNWKLYFPHQYRSLNGKTGEDGVMPIPYDQNQVEGLELYDLSVDVSETKNVIGEHPEIVEQMKVLAEQCRQELGDALNEVEGTENRLLGTLDE